MKKYFNKNYLVRFLGSIVLLIGLFWIYSINTFRSIASSCNDVAIFEKETRLSACDLKEFFSNGIYLSDQRDGVSSFELLEDIQITNFRYDRKANTPRKLSRSERGSMLGMFSLSGRLNGVVIHLECNASLLSNMGYIDPSFWDNLEDLPTDLMILMHCNNRFFKTSNMAYSFSL